LLYKRVLSSVIGIPVIILAAWCGGWVLFAVTLAIMLVALYELKKIYLAMGYHPSLPIMTIGEIIIAVGSFIGGGEMTGQLVVFVVVMFLLTGLICFPALLPGDVAVGLTGTFYIGLLVYLFLVRSMENGLVWVFILLAGTWMADIAAYVVGKTLGRKKLAPKLSPGKTIEGALGGLAGGIIGSFIVYLFASLPLLEILALGLLVGVAGLLGDLFESSLKRSAGVKDTGLIIPGHGGMLDRFDSMLFAAPALYLFVGVLNK